MVWYLGHQVKDRTSGTPKIIRNNYGSKSIRNPHGEVANFLNQDIIITGLPAGCVGHDIHFTGYRVTNIIILGKYSNHHICLRFRSGWCQDIPDSSSLGRKKRKFATQFDEMTLRDSREMNYEASSKAWASFATHVWTRCSRQTWSHGSLTIKHYRVLVGNHHWGYRNLVHDLG